ncbi:MFS transporter [Brevibacillus brevis]|uniref:MFS transporter n=1 Tax=Brevibacillus brevis TaxID=1393 RepID=A0ABY9T506_BREBE|nr:MFS transporter [Brevibacillus brevis]WNC15175.1 MFS transporter [Brevibacillus brevis]
MEKQQELKGAGGTFGSKGNLMVIMVMILGVFVAILNETLLNVALTKIMDDLGILPSTAQWLSTGYLLVIGVLIPVTAYLLQRFTTRTLFLSAMGLFTLGTFLAAVSPGFSFLVAGRVLQASGTGLLFPLLTNVVFSIVPLEKRGSAMGTIGIVITFAPAIGPTLSGIIVEHFSWRVLFYGVLPIAIFVMGFAFARLKNVTETTRPTVDLLSLLLSTWDSEESCTDSAAQAKETGAGLATGCFFPLRLAPFRWRSSRGDSSRYRSHCLTCALLDTAFSGYPC